MGDHYCTSFTVDQKPEAVYRAVLHVRGWWSGVVEGETDKPGAEFTYRYGDVHYSKQRVAELVAGEKVVWDVVDSHISFTEAKTDWNNTRIQFEILDKGGKTEVRFTHFGLVPELECYGSCSNGWRRLTAEGGNLHKLILTGNDQADAFAS
jgi:Activator of Hsp90 ATPase homolog 1-like protein.